MLLTGYSTRQGANYNMIICYQLSFLCKICAMTTIFLASPASILTKYDMLPNGIALTNTSRAVPPYQRNKRQ